MDKQKSAGFGLDAMGHPPLVQEVEGRSAGECSRMGLRSWNPVCLWKDWFILQAQTVYGIAGKGNKK